jgi:hypothetical protein
VTARTASGEPVSPGHYLPSLAPSALDVVDLSLNVAFLPPRWVVQVHGVAPGDVEIAVTVQDLDGRAVEGVGASFRVTVAPPPVLEIIPEETGPFVAGERVFFSAPYVGSAPITWQSSAPGVATVVGLFQGRAAMITTQGRGRTTITARVGLHEASMEIEVWGLSLTPTPVKVEPGGAEQRIEAFVEDTGGSTFPVPERIGLLEWRLRDPNGSWEDPAHGFSVESRGATEGAVFAERHGAAVVGAFFRRRLTITNPPPGMAADWGTYEALGATALVSTDPYDYWRGSFTMSGTSVQSFSDTICSSGQVIHTGQFDRCEFSVTYDVTNGEAWLMDTAEGRSILVRFPVISTRTLVSATTPSRCGEDTLESVGQLSLNASLAGSTFNGEHRFEVGRSSRRDSISGVVLAESLQGTVRTTIEAELLHFFCGDVQMTSTVEAAIEGVFDLAGADRPEQ